MGFNITLIMDAGSAVKSYVVSIAKGITLTQVRDDIMRAMNTGKVFEITDSKNGEVRAFMGSRIVAFRIDTNK